MKLILGLIYTAVALICTADVMAFPAVAIAAEQDQASPAPLQTASRVVARGVQVEPTVCSKPPGKEFAAETALPLCP
ncbi:hypothetical protein V5O48_012603 [Marasmius crinis-equi]|uniref:Uncharacterized protein n=1 Tax=Marasmius crinis-equi TaxID=585013 RepID=A0ABR3F2M3_9AGAR